MVSVIVPVYKVEKYLERCIKSIVNQTYKEIELIIVDDGSPDKCPEICDKWAEKDKRIKVIHKNNEGVSSARNKGIELSKGKYIVFIDQDDYVTDEHIEVLYDCITSNNVDLVISNLIDINEDGIILNNERKNHF